MKETFHSTKIKMNSLKSKMKYYYNVMRKKKEPQ